jgi:hypothetical protein
VMRRPGQRIAASLQRRSCEIRLFWQRKAGKFPAFFVLAYPTVSSIRPARSPLKVFSLHTWPGSTVRPFLSYRSVASGIWVMVRIRTVPLDKNYDQSGSSNGKSSTPTHKSNGSR